MLSNVAFDAVNAIGYLAITSLDFNIFKNGFLIWIQHEISKVPDKYFIKVRVFWIFWKKKIFYFAQRIEK